LLRAKNASRPEILRILAAQLATAVAVAGAAEGIDGIVPVPSSLAARWRRGFEPAREISRELARLSGKRLLGGVLRKRGLGGPALKALGARARWATAGGGIAARSRIPGARVLLVDDVLTTGATATACASALRSAGAVEVRVAVWARTPSPSIAFGGSRRGHL
jgi:predicted amidophosphoribosyltransferase